ncbi:hypothetical protein V6N12_005422 [Hibiscus sabdariffa]|uniref:Uncharacterized protein n=1 Tax=Hibiscus sabdariffa TaxID=183260 RepID=A0ABR2ANU3_9ROSI
MLNPSLKADTSLNRVPPDTRMKLTMFFFLEPSRIWGKQGFDKVWCHQVSFLQLGKQFLVSNRDRNKLRAPRLLNLFRRTWDIGDQQGMGFENSQRSFSFCGSISFDFPSAGWDKALMRESWILSNANSMGHSEAV